MAQEVVKTRAFKNTVNVKPYAKAYNEEAYVSYCKKHAVSISFKRFFDVLLCLPALIILSPILLLCAVIIKATSKGPAFYSQERVGRNLKPFNVIKFRTMKPGSYSTEVAGGEVRKNDSRVTAAGKILRRLKIDELPQIINVIKGDMSIIGPRPMLSRHIESYSKDELSRYYVRPGLSGLTQINGGINLSFEDRAAYDAIYIKNLSIWLDIKIIIKTFLVIILGEHKFIKTPKP